MAKSIVVTPRPIQRFNLDALEKELGAPKKKPGRPKKEYAVSNFNPRATPKEVAEALEQVNGKAENVTIKPLKQRLLNVTIKGTSPLMILRFSEKAQNKIKASHEAGGQSRSKKNRDARVFQEDCDAALYVLPDGSYGINAIGFRHALIATCRLVNFKMTIAKMSIFIEADGYDKFSGTPLVRIISKQKPEMSIMPVRNASGVMDLRARPVWNEWSCKLKIRFDEDQFSLDDVVNLLVRAGVQNGIGEGRVNSKESVGLGYGSFEVVFDDK